MGFEQLVAALAETPKITAEDYAGLPAEIITGLSQKNSQDASALLGTALQVDAREAERRKQAFEEFHANRMFEMMKNQEARETLQGVINTGLQLQSLALQKKQVALEGRRVGLTEKEHKINLQLLQKKVDALKSLSNVNLPIGADANGNLINIDLATGTVLGLVSSQFLENNLKKLTTGKLFEAFKSAGVSDKTALILSQDPKTGAKFFSDAVSMATKLTQTMIQNNFLLAQNSTEVTKLYSEVFSNVLKSLGETVEPKPFGEGSSEASSSSDDDPEAFIKSLNPTAK